MMVSHIRNQQLSNWIRVNVFSVGGMSEATRAGNKMGGFGEWG